MNYEKESEQEQHILLLSNGSSLALFVGGVMEYHVLGGMINVEEYM